ncbi:MAG: SRPBCC domain-containing protein [Pseudomonadota bacterium]
MLSVLTTIAAVLGCLTFIVVVLSALSPTSIEYEETVTINAPVWRIYDDIRLQQRLMRWSAWPKETKSKCAVDVGNTIEREDGTVGTRTVFFSKGKAMGFQEIQSLQPNHSVSFTLEGAGPPHFPTMVFTLEELDEENTKVVLSFTNRMPPPFNLIWKFAGISKWTRKMHVKDLAGLKTFSEPPHLDADGNVVGREMSIPNPYEIAMPEAA